MVRSFMFSDLTSEGSARCRRPGVANAMIKSSFGFPASGPVAQLAEQQTLNLRVEGSIPSWLTIFSSALSGGAK